MLALLSFDALNHLQITAVEKRAPADYFGIQPRWMLAPREFTDIAKKIMLIQTQALSMGHYTARN